jgi:dipeptidase D
MLDSLGKLAGAKTEAKGIPGWQPDDANSPVMHLVRETYQRLFNKTPNIQIIHAGLECGLFKKPYRTWTWSLSGQPLPARTG